MTSSGRPAGADAEASAAPRGPRRRSLVDPWVALGGTAVAWALVALADPADGAGAWCPFRRLTGLDCPFCGSTRAAASLAHGDVVGALDHNAFFVLVLLPLAAVSWGLWVARSRSGRPMPTLTTRTLAIGLGVLIAWWALRLAVPWLGSGSAG